MKTARNQKGFTIIELVVVILLLGILTATALPRFMNVENQAHDAVVTAVIGGMTTSSGLFRAQWYAEGQPHTVVDYDNMRASVGGYAMGNFASSHVSSMTASADCVDIYQSFLQPVGRPTIAIKTKAGAALTTVSGTTDFVAYLNTTDSTTKKTCTYAYTGQYQDSADGGVPVFTYNSATGALTLGTEL